MLTSKNQFTYALLVYNYFITKGVVMKKFIYLFFLSSLILTPGCIDWWGETEKKTAEKKEISLKIITTEQLKDRMKKVKELKIVNVLPEEAYKNCHITGSVNVPLAELGEKAKWWNKDEEIVLYCASYECDASKKAYEVLKEMGFTNIAAYEGGMKEWEEKQFETEGPCK